MANSYCRLSRQKTNSHQRQADPRQPVLARLTVRVEESPNSLRSGEKGIRDHLHTGLIINKKECRMAITTSRLLQTARPVNRSKTPNPK